VVSEVKVVVLIGGFIDDASCCVVRPLITPCAHAQQGVKQSSWAWICIYVYQKKVGTAP